MSPVEVGVVDDVDDVVGDVLVDEVEDDVVGGSVVVVVVDGCVVVVEDVEGRVVVELWGVVVELAGEVVDDVADFELVVEVVLAMCFGPVVPARRPATSRKPPTPTRSRRATTPRIASPWRRGDPSPAKLSYPVPVSWAIGPRPPPDIAAVPYPAGSPAAAPAASPRTMVRGAASSTDVASGSNGSGPRETLVSASGVRSAPAISSADAKRIAGSTCSAQSTSVASAGSTSGRHSSSGS